MSKKSLIAILVFFLIVSIVYAVELIPQGDINGVGLRRIYNVTNVSADNFCDDEGNCRNITSIDADIISANTSLKDFFNTDSNLSYSSSTGKFTVASGLIDWLKGWFYDETETDTQISNANTSLRSYSHSTFRNFSSSVRLNKITNADLGCSANYFMTALNSSLESITCTQVTGFLTDTGDTGNGNYIINGNITQDTNHRSCYGSSCESSIYYNGSSLIIKVN